jgi:hypothetical protein
MHHDLITKLKNTAIKVNSPQLSSHLSEGGALMANPPNELVGLRNLELTAFHPKTDQSHTHPFKRSQEKNIKE